jgi:hypothetical protein
MWTDYMSRLVTQPYVRDSQPRIIVFSYPVPYTPVVV